MARVDIDADWEAKVLGSWDVFGETRLGPEIATDARRYAPVGQSWGSDPAHPRVLPHEAGELEASIGNSMDGHDVIVEAAAPYAADVELGVAPHPIDSTGPWSLWSPPTAARGAAYYGRHVAWPGFAPRAYLRTALYQVRGE
jgi:hypothetical protein